MRKCFLPLSPAAEIAAWAETSAARFPRGPSLLGGLRCCRHRPRLLAGSLARTRARCRRRRSRSLWPRCSAALRLSRAVSAGVGLLAVALALRRLVVGERTSRCARSQSLDVSPRDRRPRAHDRHRAVAPRKVRRARAGGRHGIRGASFARARAAEAAAWTGSPARRDPGSARPSDGPARTEERVRRTDVASTSRRARRPPRRPLADRRASRRARWRC